MSRRCGAGFLIPALDPPFFFLFLSFPVFLCFLIPWPSSTATRSLASSRRRISRLYAFFPDPPFHQAFTLGQSSPRLETDPSSFTSTMTLLLGCPVYSGLG